MKKVTKYFQETSSKATSFQSKLDSYRKLELGNTQRLSTADFKAPLSQICAIAAFFAAPLSATSQCVLYSGIDLDRDGNPDIYIYSASFTNNYTGAIRSVWQLQAKALNPANQVTFFGTGQFPRSCYYNQCVFPTPDGALSGARIGSLAVLLESINSCTYQIGLVKNTNTFVSNSVTVTTCTYTYSTVYNCQPQIVNSNYQMGVPGTLGLLLNNEAHFIELTVNNFSATIHKVDGAIANPCDGGCQDALQLTCNEIFPIEDYHAEQEIQTNDIVDVSQMVNLAAGFEIEMLSGFEVLQGGEFVAEIDPNCN